MNQTTTDQEIITINLAMLNSVVAGDWKTYSSYCSEDLSCIEAETNGLVVKGLAFHRFYFPEDSAAQTEPQSNPQAPEAQATAAVNVTMAGCHSRWLGEDSVVLSYTRLTQKTSEGTAITTSCCETRIWQRQDGSWKQVHVHRS